MISDLIQISAILTEISISWSPPKTPNGIITVYEIRYRESTSTGPYNITNTTNTQYSIVGLIPNTSYTIGVRAYTSVGPGECIDRTFTTVKIRKFYFHNHFIPIFIIAIVSNFSVTQINETAVAFQWIPIDETYLYAVYYFSYLCSGSMTFSNDTNHHVLLVQGTAPLFIDLYNFTISIKVKIRGTLYEGETNSPILKGIN